MRSNFPGLIEIFEVENYQVQFSTKVVRSNKIHRKKIFLDFILGNPDIGQPCLNPNCSN